MPDWSLRVGLTLHVSFVFLFLCLVLLLVSMLSLLCWRWWRGDACAVATTVVAAPLPNQGKDAGRTQCLRSHKQLIEKHPAV